MAQKKDHAISILLWLAGLGSMIFTLTTISIDLHFVTWALDSYFGESGKRICYFHFGPGLSR